MCLLLLSLAYPHIYINIKWSSSLPFNYSFINYFLEMHETSLKIWAKETKQFNRQY